jgi:sugar phosphate isomerase/epimerase
MAGEMTVSDAIDYAADIGAEHVEIVPIGYNLHDTPELIGAIRQRASSRGLDISNYAVGANFLVDDVDAFEREMERVQREVDVAAQLGVQRMRHDVATSADVSMANFMAHLDQLAEACGRIADYASRYGIVTSVENHGYLIQGSDRVAALIHTVNKANFRTTLDIGNFMCADENPESAVLAMLPYASMIHLKDFYLRPADRNPGEGWFRTTRGNYLRGAIVGHGDIHMPVIIDLIRQSGYDGYISLEFEGLEDCRTGSRIGLENVRRMWHDNEIR